MPKINRYVDIDSVQRESRKDYIDMHSPFIHCPSSVNSGEIFSVTVKMGNEYPHPDDFDHYIANIALYNGDTLLAKAEFIAGALGNEKSHTKVSFDIRAVGNKMNLVAQAYCTKHGIWESDGVVVEVL